MDRNTVNWKGNFTAVVTPFTRSGEIDKAAFRANIENLINEGVDGVIIAGCNGEFWALTDEERKDLFEIGADQVAGRATVIGGTTAISTDQVIELTRHAKDVGLDGAMITPPFYVIPTVREIIHHYEATSQAVELPILLYNVPRRTGVNLSPDIVSMLANVENVVAIKASSADFMETVRTIQAVRDRMLVFTGHTASRGFPGVMMGADGFVSSDEPHVMGREAIALYRLAKEGRVEEAQRLQYRCLQLADGLHRIPGSPPAAQKAAMNILGRPGGYPRKPVLPVSDEAIPKVKDLLAELGLLVHA